MTESIANSSIYNEIVKGEIDDLVEFLEQDKTTDFSKKPSTKKSLKNTFTSKALSKPSIGEQMQARRLDEDKMRTIRQDPAGHFMNLKAKIKLKALKKYQEDEDNRVEEQKKAAEPKVIIKDKYGRVMQMKSPKTSTNKVPSKNRLPVKKAPPKLRLSFTECQMKYYGAKDIYNPINNMKGPKLTDKYIIDFMKSVDRFPVPEALVNRPTREPYKL